MNKHLWYLANLVTLWLWSKICTISFSSDCHYLIVVKSNSKSYGRFLGNIYAIHYRLELINKINNKHLIRRKVLLSWLWYCTLYVVCTVLVVCCCCTVCTVKPFFLPLQYGLAWLHNVLYTSWWYVYCTVLYSTIRQRFAKG